MRWLKYPSYRSSGIEWLADVPEHWEVRRLKTAASYRVSSVDKVPSESELPVRLCNYTDVYYNERIRPALDLMQTTAAAEEIRRFGLRVGDVLITKDSEDWRDIAVPALVEESARDMVCGYHLAIVRPNSDLRGEFLLRLFQSGTVNQQFQVAATGVTRYGLPKSAIGEARIPLPPVLEQLAIADFLNEETGRLDVLSTKKQALIDKLKEKRAALISRTVTRGLPQELARAAGLDVEPTLKPSGVRWIGEVPEHWQAGILRRFAQMKTGHTPSRQNAQYWEDCTIPWFTLADVWQIRDERTRYLGDTAEKISELGLANSAAELLPAGTVVLSRTASVGYSGIMPRPMATSQDFWNWVCGPQLVPEYLLYVFRAMRPWLVGLTLGSTHKTVYQPDAAGIRVPLPPVAEQRAIVDYLDRETSRIDTLVSRVEAAIQRLREYRAALITAAVTGKIDVRGFAGGAKDAVPSGATASAVPTPAPVS